MAKHHCRNKTKLDGSIRKTARQLKNPLIDNKGKFTSCEYDKLMRTGFTELPICDAVHELKTHLLETPAQRFDVRLLGRGKRVFARLDAEDDKLVPLFPRTHSTRAK